MGCCFILQVIFPTQGLNPYLLFGRQVPYHWATWEALSFITFTNWLNGHEYEQGLGNSEGQGRLVWCSPWGCKKLDMTEQLNNNDLLTFAVKSDSDIFKISHLIKKKNHIMKEQWVSVLLMHLTDDCNIGDSLSVTHRNCSKEVGEELAHIWIVLQGNTYR